VIDDRLRREILDVGLEDDIPLFEIAGACQESDLLGPGTAGIEVLARALLELTRDGAIRILVGHWTEHQPRFATPDEAELLLMDTRRYSAAEEAEHDLDRVYYVNVDNIRAS